MAIVGEITQAFAGANYRFAFGIDQLRELQEKTGDGPRPIYRRLCEGEWRVDDIRETLRLGLIGGGMSPSKATALIARHVDRRPLMENERPARDALASVLVPFREYPLGGKARAAEAKTTDASTSPPSTDPAPSSAASRREKSAG